MNQPGPAEMELYAAQVYGVYAPLAYVSPADPLQGGYQWLSPTDGGATLHPAADLNSTAPGRAPGGDADLGVAVVAAVDAVVVAVIPWDGRTTGYGNVVVLETADDRATPHAWLKHCHLDAITCAPGQGLVAGAQLGTCGRSGNQGFAHLHWEVMWAKPPSWGTWPYGWSVAEVERYWMRPADWFWATVATAAADYGGRMDVAILNDPQRAAVMTALWGEYPLNMDAAIPKSWADEWGAGRWKGRPVSAEQLVPEADDHPGGSFQVYELGCAVWLPGQEVSWTG